MKKFIFVILIALFVLAACGPGEATDSGVSQEELDQVVQATFQALTQQVEQAAQAGATEVPAVNQPEQSNQPNQNNQASGLVSNGRSDGTGSISGNLSFPSEGIPPLYVVAFNVNTGFYYWLATTQNQTTYQIDFLPPGTYHVVSYTQPGGILMAGVYNQFVLCGMTQSCTDHTVVDVTVQAGFTTSNINPGDWFSDAGTYPDLPKEIYNPSSSPKVGSISGKLSYPSESVPPLYVVAYSASDMSQYYYVTTKQGDSTYKIDNLPPDSYFVVAYVQSNSGGITGGYSQAVPCGLLASCTNHSLIPVNVFGGATSENINPGDWYAGPGVFPVFPGP